MPIVTIQQQMREIGRIRTGNQVVKNGRAIPQKLGTFRLTSDAREVIDAGARVYGGEVVQWDNNGRMEWEVVTEAAILAIAVPPGQIVSQWMELWSGGGCLRRCDGVTNTIDGQACGSTPAYVGEQRDKVIPPCPQDIPSRVAAAQRGAACKATTRLNVILPDLPDLGIWRLESHGFNAAVHLAGAARVLEMATNSGMLVPARLRLVERSKKIPGKPTNRWYEPILEMVESTPFASLGLVGGAGPVRQIAAGATPALPAIAAPVTSDFRAPEPPAVVAGEVLDPDDVEEGQTREVTCGWALDPRTGPLVPCTFQPGHPPGHSWDDQRAGGRVVPPAG